MKPVIELLEAEPRMREHADLLRSYEVEELYRWAADIDALADALLEYCWVIDTRTQKELEYAFFAFNHPLSCYGLDERGD